MLIYDTYIHFRIFRSFIEDGSVSMNSHTDDDTDFVYSTRGLSWMRDTAKLFQVLIGSCKYIYIHVRIYICM
jgi:hypothetical protein